MKAIQVYLRQINEIEVSVWKSCGTCGDQRFIVRFAKITNTRRALKEFSMEDLPIIGMLVQSVIQRFAPALPEEIIDFDKICL